MIVWATKTGNLAETSEVQKSVEQLVMANPTSYGDFMMLTASADYPKTFQLFIGVPEAFLRLFPGFSKIDPMKMPDHMSALVVSDKFPQNFPDIAAKVRARV